MPITYVFDFLTYMQHKMKTQKSSHWTIQRSESSKGGKMKYHILRGINTLAREATLSKKRFLSPLPIGVYLKRSKLFPFRVDSISRGLGVQKSKWEVMKKW